MIDPAHLPASVQTILVTRLDGLGDIVLGTQLLWGLHAKWPDARVLLVVRPQMAGVGAILPDWVEVHILSFDPREPVCGREAQIIAQLRDMVATLGCDLAVVAEYNRTWAGEILADACGAVAVLAFDGPTGLNFHHRQICQELKVGALDRWQTVHAESDAHEPQKYIAFLNALGLDGKTFRPNLAIGEEDRQSAVEFWRSIGVEPDSALVCFPGSGDQLSRTLEPGAWSRWLARLAAARPVVLLGSTFDEAILNAITAVGIPEGVRQVLVPVEKIGITAAFLERAGAYVGMDTGPMHIAAALGTPTLGIFGGGHRAHRFLPVGRRTGAIRMPLGCYGCDWLCPFDRRMCIKDIPEKALHEAADAFLSGLAENSDVFTPRIFDIPVPAELSPAMLGPIMRQHRQFLKLNHEIGEHHAFLAAGRVDHQQKLGDLMERVESMLRQNHEHGQALNRIAGSLEEMTRQNGARDQAIATMTSTLAAMSIQNSARDQAIAAINGVLTEMSTLNSVRDQAIADLKQADAKIDERIWFAPGNKNEPGG